MSASDKHRLLGIAFLSIAVLLIYSPSDMNNFGLLLLRSLAIGCNAGSGLYYTGLAALARKDETMQRGPEIERRAV